MCTKEQVKEAVIDVLYDHNEDGETIVGQEVNRHITNKGNQIISSLTFRFAIAFIGLLLSVAASWYALYYQVQANAREIERNSAQIELGGRITKEDLEESNDLVQRQILELKEKDAELKQDQIEATNIVRSDIRELRNLILSTGN